MGKLEIRKISRPDLDIAISWAADEGWNPGLYDADCFYETDPDGFFMAFIDGEPVGSISAVAYGDSYGFIGFFIVKPEYRGHRVGLELGRVGMEYLGNRLIGIDGVENKVKNYETHGFKLACNNARYEGRAKGSDAYNISPSIRPLSEIPFEDIAAYDRRCFPAPRKEFLKRWIVQPESYAFASVNKDAQLSGYGLIRKCGKGYKIGPLFAEDYSSAEEMFNALLAKIPEGELFYLDMPVVNCDAKRLAESANMNIVFRTARMYNSNWKDESLSYVFGITSFELG
jgi:ribosomal protein S18 acetylase RimI-like enzyme